MRPEHEAPEILAFPAIFAPEEYASMRPEHEAPEISSASRNWSAS